MKQWEFLTYLSASTHIYITVYTLVTVHCNQWCMHISAIPSFKFELHLVLFKSFQFKYLNSLLTIDMVNSKLGAKVVYMENFLNYFIFFGCINTTINEIQTHIIRCCEISMRKNICFELINKNCVFFVTKLSKSRFLQQFILSNQ